MSRIFIYYNNEIIRIYELYLKLGYCPSYIKENVEKIYNSYHKLGGDGMITTMVEWVDYLLYYYYIKLIIW